MECNLDYGLYEITLTGPPEAVNYFGWCTTTVKIRPYDTRDTINNAALEALCERMNVSPDDLVFPILEFSEPVKTTNEWVNPDGMQTYFVTVYEADRGYGGPEEGGWWFDVGTPIRHYACRSYTEAEELRDKLRETEFPYTGKRNSVLGGEDYDVGIGLEPGKAYPDRKPHYE